MKTVTFNKKFRKYNIGQQLHVIDSMATVLVKMGVAAYDEPMKKNEPELKNTLSLNKSMAPQKTDKDKKPVVIQEEKPAARRGRPPNADNTYKTRDMKAE